MADSENYSVPENNATKATTENRESAPYLPFRISLVVIYAVSLLGGTLGVFFMSRFLRRSKSKLSITTTSIINLVVAHGLFLLTLPFRIDYYISNTWHYPFDFCKLVSIAIHTHLYISFFFYVAILAVRLLPSLPTRDFYRPQTAFISSAAVWVLFTISIFPPLWLEYGKSANYTEKECFKFHSEITGHVVPINITISSVIIVVSVVILVIQVMVLNRVIRSSQGDLFSRQEFRAQLKNLSFLIIMILCFLPYHVFRIYYVQHVGEKGALQWHNEIYLSITTLCCLDLLTFLAI
ncbi:probable G-protein coupled receptor 141 [Megalops cyprinoides]|uniref:probable G-protein coupled receptor 141 n=1 Tax=Megalops cyprinoides TaxID=118141 RepID=UPI0018641E24|nr:probable G-protein coupled receptor 141 [Megalops cyprinoides]